MLDITRDSPRDRASSSVLALVVAVLAVACGAESGSDGSPPPGRGVASVIITSASDTIATGDSVLLQAAPRTTAGEPVPSARITWQSSDTSIARVDSTGRVRTARSGAFSVTATATAFEDGQTTSASATKAIFSKRMIVAVALSRAAGTDTVAMDDTVRVVAVVRDGVGNPITNAQVSWSVSDTAVANVDGSGLVHARAIGPVTVTASVTGPADMLRGTVIGTSTVTVRLAFTRIDAGTVHTCGITRGGAVYCWGEGAWGRLGNGASYPAWTSISRPVRALTSDAFTAISLDEQQDSRSGHTCGVTTDAAVACWGSGAWGMLGDGVDGEGIPPHMVLRPTRVGTGAFVDVAAGAMTTCALTASGDAYCAGSNGSTQLGVDTVAATCVTEIPSGSPYVESCSSSFVRVNTTTKFSRIFKSGYTTCGLTSTGAAWCWGMNLSGDAGVGTVTSFATPTPVAGGLSFATLAGGSSEMCGLTVAGIAYCWGRGGFGALGNGTQAMSLEPSRIATLVTFTQISAGNEHVCAITGTGDTYCWGVNTNGELGVPTTESCSGNASYSVDCSTRPVQVPNVPPFVGIAAGGNHTCGLTATGTVYCWGAGSRGQLGNGRTVDSNVPVRVADTK